MLQRVEGGKGLEGWPPPPAPAWGTQRQLLQAPIGVQLPAAITCCRVHALRWVLTLWLPLPLARWRQPHDPVRNGGALCLNPSLMNKHADANGPACMLLPLLLLQQDKGASHFLAPRPAGGRRLRSSCSVWLLHMPPAASSRHVGPTPHACIKPPWVLLASQRPTAVCGMTSAAVSPAACCPGLLGGQLLAWYSTLLCQADGSCHAAADCRQQAHQAVQAEMTPTRGPCGRAGWVALFGRRQAVLVCVLLGTCLAHAPVNEQE
jgi:hypothetical protein